MLYPLNVQLAGKRCVVIGGGHVALRKVLGLLACKAWVTLISPHVHERLADLALAGEIQLHLRPFAPGDLAGAFLVFAATDNPGVQEQVAAEAVQEDVLLNIADMPERCGFHVPAQVRRGGLLLTVSTGGASPAMSKMIRRQLEDQFDDAYDKVVSLLARVRREVVGPATDSEANRHLFTRLLELGLVDMVRGDRWSEIGALLAAELPAGIEVEPLLAGLADR